MLGPVFALEPLRERRRGRYSGLLPWAYAALLGLQVLFMVADAAGPRRSSGIYVPDLSFITGRVQGLVTQHFVILFLLTPAVAAPAFSEEKAKGILTDLFTTALTSWEIVLGKLLGRSLRAARVLVAGLPVLCAVAGYAGLPLAFCAALVLLTLLAVVAVTALSLVAAVGSRHASGAVLGTYVLLGIGAFAVVRIPLPALDPFRTLASCWAHPESEAVVRPLLEATLAWGLVAGTGFGIAVWQLRPSHARQMEGRVRKRGAVAPHRPPVGDDPIRWQEYHIVGLAPLPLLRGIPRWAGVLVVLAVSLGGSFAALRASGARAILQFPFGSAEPFIEQGLLFLFVATLVVTARSAGAVTGERERQTWDSLRVTALEGQEFIDGKLRGILDAVIPYYVAYALPPFFLSAAAGPGCFIATGCSLLLAWPLMYYAAACGVRGSVFARSTWRGLVMALLGVYVTGLLMCFAVCIATGVLFTALAISHPPWASRSAANR